MRTSLRSSNHPSRLLLGTVVLAVLLGWVSQHLSTAFSQEHGQDASDAASTDGGATGAAGPRTSGAELNLFQITWDSKWWMLPIGIMSVIAVAVSVERAISLSRRRVIPEPLIAELGRLADSPTGFDPRQAFRICQRYPSAAANVIRAMLLKVGRPHSEVEHTVQESSQREAQRLYHNVRWLTLASGVCPLLGLIGTVWGMIVSFHQTTQLLPGQDKANFLAEGIYLALVTTLGGLAVAIPSTVLAHYFEGRIMNLFFQIDELVFNLLPQIEKFEGRVRFTNAEQQRETNANGEPLAEPTTASKRK